MVNDLNQFTKAVVTDFAFQGYRKTPRCLWEFLNQRMTRLFNGYFTVFGLINSKG